MTRPLGIIQAWCDHRAKRLRGLLSDVPAPAQTELLYHCLAQSDITLSQIQINGVAVAVAAPHLLRLSKRA